MLLVMTFNVGILVAVIAGQTLGYAVLPKPISISEGLLEATGTTQNVY